MPNDALLVPVGRLLERPHEQLPEPQRVGTVLVDHRVGRDHVALALGHLLAVAGPDHSLVAQDRERFLEVDQPGVEHHLGPHPRVQQMHHGVLGTADVEIDRQPVIRHRALERRAVVMWRGEAQKVPRRTGEAVERVGLALGRTAAFRTSGVDELGRRWPAASARCPRADNSSCRAAGPEAAPREPARYRRAGSRRSGWGIPSSADARLASRASGR